MTVTERLMKPGQFDIKFLRNVPVSVLNKIREFDHVVITSTRILGINSFSDAQMLAQSMYTGVITHRPNPTSLSGQGLAYWLGTDQGVGDLLDTAVTGTAANFATWIGALIPASLAAGTITSPAGTLTCTYQYVTRREAIDNVCKLFSAEWKIAPDGKLSAAVPATLFTQYTSPLYMVTRHGESFDGPISASDPYQKGMQATSIERSHDVQGYTSKIIVVGQQGAGTGVTIGSATATPVYKDLFNNDVVMERLVNAPALGSTFAGSYATAALSLYPTSRQSVSLSSSEYAISARIRPGDQIYAFDPVAGIYDINNAVRYRGEITYPMKLRCKAYTWPILRGMGVYVRRSGATPVYTDVTDYINWEDGQDTQWEVGTSPYDSDQDPDQLNISYLGVNPAIVDRISDMARLPWGYVTKTTNGTATNITNVASTPNTVTWTAVANRRYKVTLRVVRVTAGALDDTLVVSFCDAANTPIANAIVSTLKATWSYTFEQFFTLGPLTPGSFTVNVRAVNVGTTMVWNNGGYESELLVEDIGPT